MIGFNRLTHTGPQKIELCCDIIKVRDLMLKRLLRGIHMRNLNKQERVIKFLDYLKKNTDIDHTIKPEDIRKAFTVQGLNIGNSKTLHDFIIELADAFNLDKDEIILPKADWRIVFDDYVEAYSDNADSQSEKDYLHIKNLYYNPEFSYEDIDALVEAIRFSRTMEPDRADKLIDILENNFASKYYKQSPRHICKVYEAPVCESETLKENLSIIQEAIDDNVQIEYSFNGYTRDNKLAPIGDYTRKASPYYLISDNGKYYLIAANERHGSAYIIRVDLMSEVTIPRSKDGKGGIKRIPKKTVKGLPQYWQSDYPYWESDYPLTHYQMSYDAPEYIDLRIHNPKDEDGKSIDPEYTFLHDAFGDNFFFTGTDKEDQNYDIVQVKCSPFGMVNFALQYSSKVEVLEPPHVREKVKERVAELKKKYSK